MGDSFLEPDDLSFSLSDTVGGRGRFFFLFFSRNANAGLVSVISTKFVCGAASDPEGLCSRLSDCIPLAGRQSSACTMDLWVSKESLSVLICSDKHDD